MRGEITGGSERRVQFVYMLSRAAEYSPAFDGEVPEDFSAAAPCKLRKRFIDGTVKDCETFYCSNVSTKVESQAWTGFTIFRRAQDPDPWSAMANLEQGMTPDMEKAYSGFIAQRMMDEENQSGKVNKTLDYNAATGDMKKGMFDARAKEWAKYKSVDTTVVMAGEEKDKLLAQGHRPIPRKRVDTMKNMHKSHKSLTSSRSTRHALCLVETSRRWKRARFAVIRLPANLSHLVLASSASSLRWRLLSGVNDLQKSCNPKGTVSALKEANKTVELTLQNVDFKFTLPANHVDWTKDLAVVTFSDASFAGGTGYKSQQGRFCIILSMHRT